MEIERKWLIEAGNIPYDLSGAEKHELEQAYVCFDPTVRIRSVDNSRFILTVKGSPLEGCLSREEFETELSKKAYLTLLGKHEGAIVKKTRYRVKRADGLTEEIDIFKGELRGLAYLEIEFPSEAQARAFPAPDWVTREVTREKGYSNGALARHGLPGARRR